MNDSLYHIAITRIPLVGAITARTLISYCGSAEAVFKAKKRELLKIPDIGERTVANICNSDALAAAETELQFLEKNNIRSLFYLDDTYPSRLKHYQDSPVLLYYKGTANLNAPRIVSIVGTRKPTPQGLGLCEEIVEGLQRYDVLILSGLAFGIDAAAHKKCVELGIPTLGALGHGFDQLYPPQHRHLADKMVLNGGLLTEYPSHTKLDPRNFPMRNRIIAGLCDALIVIETGIKGGSMITAHMANEYNKDVFAIPGRVKDKQSQGCNHLIKTHKAALIESAADIAYVMRWQELDAQKQIQQQLFVELSEEEKIIVALLHQKEALGIDQLLLETRTSSSELANTLLNLEFKGVLRSLPGKRYVLV